jgi:transposase
VVTREAERITGAEMIALFEDLTRRHPEASTITHMLDNATYNRAASVRNRLALPECQVRLVYLPPYAPNLNLIERLWWCFKKKQPWNRHDPTLADFKAAIRGFFADLSPWKSELASLIIGRFHFIGAKPTRISAE